MSANPRGDGCPPSPSPSRLPPVPASPTYSYASTANPLSQYNLPLPPPPRTGAHAVLTKADLEHSQQAYSDLISSAKAYRLALASLSTAASSFGSALESCARLKEARADALGPAAGASLSNSFNTKGSCTADTLLTVAGLQHLVANHQHILSETVYRAFEVPLLHEMDKWRATVEDEEEGYARAVAAQSKEIRRLEKEGMKLHKQRRRDVGKFRSHLVEFTLTKASPQPAGSSGEEYEVRPGLDKALIPGTWRIKFNEFEVLDFRILEKRPARLLLPSNSSSDLSGMSETVNSAGKRSFVADANDPLSPEKKHRLSVDEGDKKEDGVIMFLPAKTNPLVFPLPNAEKGKEVVTTNGHPLLELQPEETVEIPGGCELDEYAITKREPIASTSLSSVFTADHSKVPDGVIVVKVLKTRSPNSNGVGEGRNVIRQADVWLRELQYQEDLQHRSIVRLYGGDARFLSLYMEHVDARDLSSKGTWRSPSTDLFAGERSDAVRILRDITSALNYIHDRNLIHNDIKPANILYSRERGAVLCDLGLSTHSRDPPSIGGTPWYVPPEYVALKQRGAPSDVWALGVTMLYVLGKMSFPDARGHRAHPKHIHWLIAKVHQHPRDRNPQPEAAANMRRWLAEVAAAREALNVQGDRLERLVYEMLVPNPNHRIKTDKIKDRVAVIVQQVLGQQISEK